jgi:glycosyltransferase involved in cell wall biosynthesis
MRLSIVIPVYNEERTIGEVLDSVFAVDLAAVDREVIVVDDGSKDGTVERVRASAHFREGRVQLQHNPINLGKGAAVRLGFAKAAGDIILVQDADLEFDPAAHASLIRPIVEGRADVVYGSRFMAGAGSIKLHSKLANHFLTTLTNVLFWSNLTDMETAHKVFRREVLDGIRLRCVGFDFEPEVTARLLLAGRRIVDVPVGYQARSVAAGKKLRWTDGLDAIFILLKIRLTG